MAEKIYDLIILGGGCAGLTAAIYAGRARLHCLVLEGGVPGGQVSISGMVENYPGAPEISGAELAERMLDQARSFGAGFEAANIVRVQMNGEIKELFGEKERYRARALILATGASPRKLGFEGEEEFLGRGIGYCATCDGFLYRDKEIFVVGGGNSAAEEALFLTRFGRKVTLLVRKDHLRCEEYLSQAVLSHPKIELRFHTELVRAFGDSMLTGIETKDNLTGETRRYYASEADERLGLFIFVGYTPATALFHDQLKTDKMGYLITNEKMETEIAGVYAAGDVRLKPLRQLVTAAADGAIAAAQAGIYLRGGH